MEKLWDFFSGKKTGIGAALLTVCGTLQILELEFIEPNYIEALFYFAATLTGTGIVHRKVKAAKGDAR